MTQVRYQLGVDLGTTYTAAAVCRDGQDRPEVVALGSTSNAIASVVFLGADGAMVVGEAAARRALTEPRRIAREFKRRIGDGTPLLVGGEPVAADDLSARFTAWVVAEVAEREGGAAESITVTHPVEWGEHKRATFAAALASHDLGHVTFLTEPQAAAVGYAGTEGIEPGGVVGVYDLGGGTFDAAVVRRSTDGTFELLGRPTGIEQLGGVDFDDAILAHVRTALGTAWQELDPTDPSVQSAVAGLRRECTAAKEALSADTEVLIPVMLPGTHTQVRLGRTEFEDMIRGSVGETVEALRRAIDSSGLTPDDLEAVLLVGGSSRIPLVSQMVSAELGRSIAVDADPKAVVAAGAALTARGPLQAAAPSTDLDLLDEAPLLPPVAFDAPPEDDEDIRPRRRRTLLLAASIAVAATFSLSATLATGVIPLPTGVAEADAILDGPGAGIPAAIDPWTGAPRAETTPAGPMRPDAVAAPVRPAARNVATGAAGASAVVPRPAAPAGPTVAPAPAARVPAAGAPAAPAPGAPTQTTNPPAVEGGQDQAATPPSGDSASAPDVVPSDPPPPDPTPEVPPVTEPEPATPPADPSPPPSEPPPPADPPAPAAADPTTPVGSETATA